MLVFAHGGGWTSGDKGLEVAGADIYANIGRWFASEGVGAAVINYRLQPEVGWRDQVEDVAAAVAWVHANVARFGGNPDAIFVAGHSAGGHLVTYVALDPALAASAAGICGVVPVSGAGLDVADARSWALGGPGERYYAERLRGGDPGDGWMRAASPIHFVRPDAPPALVLYADGESRGLQRQAWLLHQAFVDAGVPSRVVVVPGESHERILLTLSRPDKTAAPAILAFIRATPCPRPPRSAE